MLQCEDVILRQARGFSLTEAMVGIAVSSIVALGIATFLTNMHTAQSNFESQLEVHERLMELSQILASPRSCDLAIGGGFDPAMAFPGMALTIPDGIPAVIIRNPTNPTTALLSEFPTGSYQSAPVSARIGKRGIIRNLQLRDLDAIGTPSMTTYTDGTRVSKMSVSANLVVEVEDTRNQSRSHQLTPRMFSITFQAEQNEASGLWRFGSCSPGVGQDTSMGWNNATVAAGDCITVSPNPGPLGIEPTFNTPVSCPRGMYMTSQTHRMVLPSVSTVSCPQCGKYGCLPRTCTSTTPGTGGTSPSIICCPVIQ
jgi:hypothetical protein